MKLLLLQVLIIFRLTVGVGCICETINAHAHNDPDNQCDKNDSIAIDPDENVQIFDCSHTETNEKDNDTRPSVIKWAPVWFSVHFLPACENEKQDRTEILCHQLEENNDWYHKVSNEADHAKHPTLLTKNTLESICVVHIVLGCLYHHPACVVRKHKSDKRQNYSRNNTRLLESVWHANDTCTSHRIPSWEDSGQGAMLSISWLLSKPKIDDVEVLWNKMLRHFEESFLRLSYFLNLSLL